MSGFFCKKPWTRDIMLGHGGGHNTNLFVVAFDIYFAPHILAYFAFLGMHGHLGKKDRKENKTQEGSTESRAEWGGFLSSLPECIDLGTFAYYILAHTHICTQTQRKHNQQSPIHGINELS